MKTTASQSCGVGPNKCLILGWTLYCFLCGVKLEPFILPLKSWRSAWSERGCSGGCVTWILLTHPVTNQEHSGVHIPVDPVSSQCCVVNSMLSLTPDCTADQTSRLLHLLRGEGRFIGSCNFHVRSLEPLSRRVQTNSLSRCNISKLHISGRTKTENTKAGKQQFDVIGQRWWNTLDHMGLVSHEFMCILHRWGRPTPDRKVFVWTSFFWHAPVCYCGSREEICGVCFCGCWRIEDNSVIKLSCTSAERFRDHVLCEDSVVQKNHLTFIDSFCNSSNRVRVLLQCPTVLLYVMSINEHVQFHLCLGGV